MSPDPFTEGSAVKATDKKEKKKRIHDPNAPKRPLTAFFLFMKTARGVIATELGPEAKPKDVSETGTARWGAMSPGSKRVCDNFLDYINYINTSTLHVLVLTWSRSGKTTTKTTSVSTTRACTPTK